MIIQGNGGPSSREAAAFAPAVPVDFKVAATRERGPPGEGIELGVRGEKEERNLFEPYVNEVPGMNVCLWEQTLAMGETIFITRDPVTIDTRAIERLKERALANPRRRARVCLHGSHDEPLQQMILAICRGVYIPPHKHERKAESFHLIEGRALVAFFDNDGIVTERVLLDYEKGMIICRMERNRWHTMVPLSKIVVFHEVTEGPFTGHGDKTVAPWAPLCEDEKNIRELIERILDRMP